LELLPGTLNLTRAWIRLFQRSRYERGISPMTDVEVLRCFAELRAFVSGDSD
jgi:hypothetical protein